MGTWGPKLYQDDLANDIKIKYEELLKKGKSNKESIEFIYKIYKDEIENSDERPVFWMALSDVLCNNGNLTSFVKEKALKEIEIGENIKRWEKESDKDMYIERKKELELLKRKLEEYKEPKEKIVLKKSTVKQEENKEKEWKIGDTYAYKIENTKYKGQYLILRKVNDCKYGNNIKYQSAIIYIQITSDKKMPKNENEISKLEYIITSNEGNVKHQYRMKLEKIPKKETTELIYLGNFQNIKTPEDEYIENIELNIWGHSFKDIEFLITEMDKLGTNIEPVYYEVNPKDISDSHIRFLMRVEYYKKVLKIEPPKGSIVKDNPLLYIALIDSLLIGGFVKNPVEIVIDKKIKEETYKKIKELKEYINSLNDINKEEKINILSKFEEKIRRYNIQSE